MQVPSLSVPGAPKGAPDSSSGSFRTRSSRRPPGLSTPADPARPMAGLRRPMLLLGAIWLLGVIAIGAVVRFESRVDTTGAPRS